MPESKLTQTEVLEARSKIESIDGKLDLLLGANKDVRGHVYNLFKGKPSLARMYLTLDGEENHSATSTRDRLAAEFGCTPQNVGQVLKALRQHGIISFVELPDGKILFKKNSCERLFQISKFLRKEFGINDRPLAQRAQEDTQISQEA